MKSRQQLLIAAFTLLFSLTAFSSFACNANFTTNSIGNLYWFTNTSTQPYTNLVWQFSNGDTSHANYPSVAFNTTGPQWACLSLYDQFGGLCDTLCVYFNVNCIASASYSVSGLTVNFTYTGTPATTYSWQFGDGNSSSSQNPNHTYSTGGTYWVSLLIYDSLGGLCDTTNFPVTVSGSGGSGCTATASFSSGYFGNWMWLYNTSTGNYASHVFVFSDGDSSTSNNFNHYFQSTGPQWACLYLFDSVGNVCDTSCRYITVSCLATASFTVSGLTANFTYTGSPAVSYYWQFGDGNTSNQQNPSHTYLTGGTYNVVLQINDSSGPCDTVHLQVTVSGGSGCSANASFNTNNTGNFYWFNNTSTGNYGSVIWQFSNGDTSSSNNPVTIFNTTGTHYACMYLYDSLGNFCDSTCVGFNVGCVARASYTVSCMTVSTTYTGSAATSYIWKFGGTTYTTQNASHTFSTPGTYYILLQTSNSTSGCTDTTLFPVTVAPCSTGCNATANFTYGNVGNRFWFTNTSSGSYAYQVWHFSNGDTSLSMYPSQSFNTVGTHWACLYLYDSLGNLCDSTCQSLTVNCVASATYTISGLTVSFTYTGSAASGYQWQFGDGNGSSLQNPVHTYLSSGTYNVTLTIFDSLGNFCDTIPFQITLTGTATCNGQAAFTHQTQGSNTWLYFAATGSYSSFKWLYSDGTSSTVQNAFKSWNNPGWKTICLVLYDSIGAPCDSLCASMYISCVSNFNFVVNGLSVTFTQQAQGSIGSYYWYFGDNTNSSSANPTHAYASAGTYTACLYVNDPTGGFCDSLCKQVQVGGTAIDPGRNQLQAIAYPNPATGQFKLELPGLQSGEVNIEVTDLLGKSQFRKSLIWGGNPEVIEVNHLPSGTYFLSVTAGELSGHLKMIIKN